MIERLVISLLVMMSAAAVYVVWQRWYMRRVGTAESGTGKPSILYFRSAACPPCMAQGRFLQQLEEQIGNAVTIERIDADLDRERAARYRVFTVPTTLVLDARGEVRHANYGLTPARKLAEQLGSLGMDGEGI